MINLNINNVEQLIFYDKKVQQILPEYSQVFHKWTLGIRTGITSMAKDALLDLINKLTTDQIKRLESLWGSPVILQKLDSSTLYSFTVPIASLQERLNEMIEPWNVSFARDESQCYVCTWR
jgi:hypothetical protein